MNRSILEVHVELARDRVACEDVIWTCQDSGVMIELEEVDLENRACYRIVFVSMTLTYMGPGVGDS